MAYTPRTTIEIEQRYSQIEKEALEFVWSCKIILDQIIGKKIHLETDHKPLIPLFSNKIMFLVNLFTQLLCLTIQSLTKFFKELMHFPVLYSIYNADLVHFDQVECYSIPTSKQVVFRNVKILSS